MQSITVILEIGKVNMSVQRDPVLRHAIILAFNLYNNFYMSSHLNLFSIHQLTDNLFKSFSLFFFSISIYLSTLIFIWYLKISRPSIVTRTSLRTGEGTVKCQSYT